MTRKKISIVIPVFNEEAILETLHGKLAALCDTLPFDFEFVFVDDGSSDLSLERLTQLSAKDPRVVALSLSRNFGQHPALTAGIDHATGDAVVLMDADLEDDPEHLRRIIEPWEQGNEVVLALRGRRRTGLLRAAASKLFHMLNRCFDPRSTEAGTFSLMDRRVVEVLRRMPERNRYVPALRSLAGFRQTGVVLDRGERYDRRSRVSILRLLRLAIDNWISHSRLPLKLASFAGLFLSVVGFGAIVFIVVYQLWLGFRVSGWASVMVTVIFAGGVQLICLGILGEYVGQVLDEVKGRPVYVVRSLLRGGKAEAPPHPKLEAS